MIGMNANTGRSLGGRDHIYQSIGKILTTPRGSRLQRRTFGADLFDLVHAPGNLATRVRVFSAVATALMRQEPRLQLRRVGLADVASSGSVVFDIEGVADASGEAISTSVVIPVGGQA